MKLVRPQTLTGFADELEKIAKAVPVVTDRVKIKKALKPGDILVTQPHGSFLRKHPHHVPLRVLLKTFQGTPWTHSAIYAGGGKVIDAGTWNGAAKVHKVKLDEFADRYSFKVLRVRDAVKAERDDAVTWAKKQTGKKFNFKHLVRMALPVKKSDSSERVREEGLQSMICSQLVANAYPSQRFGASRRIQDVRPVDIQKSSLTKAVAIFKK